MNWLVRFHLVRASDVYITLEDLWQCYEVVEKQTNKQKHPTTMLFGQYVVSLMFQAFCPLNLSVYDACLLIGSSFFVSPELSSVRDYVITHSVRSM